MESAADIAKQIFIHQCLQIFGFSFLFWDHIISLEAEVRHIWARPKGRSAYIFFIHRYSALLGNISVIIITLLTTVRPQKCANESLLIYRQVLLFFTQAVIYVLTVELTLWLIMRIKWTLIAQKSTVAPMELGTTAGCQRGPSHNTAIRLAGAWEASFSCDTILFVLTLIKTYQLQRKSVLKTNLISLILRDAYMESVLRLMALANLLNILTFYIYLLICNFVPQFAPLYLRGGLSTFATCISVTMVSHMMLNLHESTEEGLYSTTVNTDTMIYMANPPAGTEAISYVFSTVFEDEYL
ncbi:hypothetical protein BDP27DRAFT_1365403 [Rhodocollybia butyracea]|uniref:DUF6533 domain-containing protein n=1 Tax=Rhodocollybia butyracea TaxID=206335 RepID=A0A9P5U4H2_9AGAR|nr:hypothetical protein BDP27DRAFT_1365403 [Rhodocollybia butyracea]